MSDFLPSDFDCSDAVRQTAEKKIAALEAVADELPVYIILDARDVSVVHMSRQGLQLLGVTQEEVRRLGPGYQQEFFNPADVAFYRPRYHEAMQSSLPGQWFSFFQQVRTGDGRTFEWYLTAVKPFVYDDSGHVLLHLAFALQLDPGHHLTEKAERLMKENLLLKDNYQRFASLTGREKELLPRFAIGQTAKEISEHTFLSEKTIQTHRRNIKRKLGVKSQFEMLQFAQAFNFV